MALVKCKSMTQLKIGECMTILVMVAAVDNELYTEIPKNAGAYLPSVTPHSEQQSAGRRQNFPLASCPTFSDTLLRHTL